MTHQASPVQAQSQLESLPVEILQKIFLHCLEFNLPRTSFRLARTLSSPILYTWLIRLAFSSANESSRKGFFTPEFLPPPLDYFALSVEERRELQSIILNCRWCTLDLMRKCQGEYIEHAIRSKCRDLVFTPEDEHIISNIKDHLRDLQGYDHGDRGRLGKGDLVFRAKDRKTDMEYRIAIWLNVGAFQIRQPNRIHTDLDLFRLPCCVGRSPSRIPDKLLRHPWTDKKIEFLSLLATEMYIDDDDNHERSERVLRQLIRNRDFDTFEILAELFIRVKVYRYPVRWPILPIHFKAALKYADPADDPFVRYLAQKRWEDLPWYDSGLKDQVMAKMGPDFLPEITD